MPLHLVPSAGIDTADKWPSTQLQKRTVQCPWVNVICPLLHNAHGSGEFFNISLYKNMFMDAYFKNLKVGRFLMRLYLRVKGKVLSFMITLAIFVWNYKIILFLFVLSLIANSTDAVKIFQGSEWHKKIT